MKILYIGNLRMPTERAYGVAVMRTCYSFARMGHDVFLAYAKRKNPITKDVFSYYGVEKKFSVAPLTHIDALSFGQIGYRITVISFFPSAVLCVWRTKPDVVYTRDDITAYVLTLLFKNIIVELHTKKSAWYVKYMLRRVKAIVCISEGLKQYYVDTFSIPPNNILVAPSGVDLEGFKMRESKEKLRERLSFQKNIKIVGYLGKLSTMGEPKGVEGIINAFSKVYVEKRDAVLLLAGVEEKEKNVVQKAIADAGVPQKAVRVMGHISQKAFPTLFSVCDVLVMNYPSTEHYGKYMSPLKLFEYMASGVPIVTSDLPTIREIVDESMVTFARPEDVESLAHSIVNVLENYDEAYTRAKKAKQIVKKYTWDERARKILHMVAKQ